jgi:GDP-L-fucose synthase
MVEQLFDFTGKRVWVAGSRGMVGSALVRRLKLENCEIITSGREEVDLCRQTEVEEWMGDIKPDAIYVAAAKVGGIHANNTQPVNFLYDNLMIEANIIHAAHSTGVAKLMFLGSSCIYPRLAPQPMVEDVMLTGPLEPTNQWYAIAKIAGIKLCEAYRLQHGCDFISAMPTNLYGPGDNFDLMSSHVPAAMIVKTHNAKVKNVTSVEVWGTGTPKREFMYVDDLADALIFLMKYYSDLQHVNIGSGQEISIRELTEIVAKAVGYEGSFHFNAERPDGPPRKLIDNAKLQNLGWSGSTRLEDGFSLAYDWYVENVIL